MAQQQDQFDPREEFLQLLLEKVGGDPYPSVTMLDMIEQLLTPDDVEAYASMLMDKIRKDQFPSYGLMNRVLALG